MAKTLKRKFGKRPRSATKLEKTVEQSAVDFAKAKGVMSRKMNGAGFRAWPDRCFFPPDMGVEWNPCAPVLWVEFKRVGEGLTPAQADLHKSLCLRGQRVCTVCTMDEFKQHFCAYMSEDLGQEEYHL